MRPDGWSKNTISSNGVGSSLRYWPRRIAERAKPRKIATALRGTSYSGVADVTVDDKGQFHTDWDVGQMERGGKITWTTVKAQ